MIDPCISQPGFSPLHSRLLYAVFPFKDEMEKIILKPSMKEISYLEWKWMVKQCIWGISCPERPVGHLHRHCFHVNVMQNGLSLSTWGILIHIWFSCMFHYNYILTILPTRLIICFSFYMPHGFSSLFRCLLNFSVHETLIESRMLTD